MPRGDGTGPMGWGPMTGRAAGICAGYGMPGFMNPIPGRGLGMGWGRGGFGGRGRGWRWMSWAAGAPGRGGYGAYAPGGAPFAPAPAAERDLLRGQAQALQAQLEQIKRRLDELEAEKPGN